ncbi:hypothetical protein MTR67_042587 [Solanum verrucosum]|uniref:C-JID domain-containing protein n=1 Tax=Solanum verrucosum TaxID=315347 RepID=A0AAF0ZRA0_SOLVR|nr:hypothetical protein MTR67_042587 [Solanum verrucosum]
MLKKACSSWMLLPTNFNPRRLVHLDLRWSSLHYLRIDLSHSKSLKRAPDFKRIPNLEYLNLGQCTSLEEVHPSLKYCKKLIRLHLFECRSLERFPYVNVESLEYLNLNYCDSLQKFPEILGIVKHVLGFSKELIGNLSGNNFKHLPRSIAQLGALEYLILSDCKRLTQLPEDIGCLSSLKVLYLKGNNFEYLPQSISELGALRSLGLSDCKRLTQLPEFPQQLLKICADWSNDSFCNSLFQNISSFQHDICSSDSLSLRVFGSWVEDIPSWFKYQGMCPSVSVDLPENWYDKFLGFTVCYYDEYYIDCIRAHLIPSCDDGMSSMTQQFSLSNKSELDDDDVCNINFLLVPLCGLWDASNANETTPNDYGRIKLDFIGHVDDFGEKMKIGVRLLSKNDFGEKMNCEEEATCSSSKKQRLHISNQQ